MVPTVMRERRVELAVAALVFATAFLIELGSTVPPDTWWQLVSGDRIVADGFPAVDTLTWTQAGREWQPHGWLGHVLLYGLSEWLGVGALAWIFAGLVALGWTGVFVAAPGNPFGRAVVVLIGAAAAAPLTSAETRTLSLVMLAAVVMVVELVGRGRWPRLAGWAVAPILLLWSNLDTWYLVGVAYILVRSLADRASGRRDDEADRQGAVLGAGVVGLAATLFNPWVFDGPRAAVRRLVAAPRSQVAELSAPDFQQPDVWPWIVFVGVIVLGMAFRRRPAMPHLLVFFGFFVAAMISYEYVAVHALVGAPVGAVALAEGRRDRAPASAVAVLALVVATWALVQIPDATDRWIRAESSGYPAGAVQFLVERGAENAAIFNEVAWGGYAAWSGIAPFVDSRYLFHRDEFVSSAIDAANATRAWGAVEDTWQPEIVLLRPSRGLGQLLRIDPEWELAYEDDTAVVFLRTSQ